jgi:Zn-dependent peptidase ImmA (M78 family)
MNRETREAILRGVGGAAEVHDALKFRERHRDGLSAIDVFGVIDELQIPLDFRELGELLGSFVRVTSTDVGILVTTQRDLHMQRFTAAHELGHFILEHEDSMDREIRPPGQTRGRDPREVEADAFAAEFLLPKWLVQATAKRRYWWAEESLRSAEIVYQLSLRLAASYEATCWGLAAHEFITQATAEGLVAETLKDVKKRTLGRGLLQDWRGDVWLLGAGDDGAKLDAGPNDVFIFELEERAATGFRWDAGEVTGLGFRLIDDMSSFDESVVGGTAQRRLVFSAPPPETYDLHLPQRRSFSRSGDGNATLRLSISTHGARLVGNLPSGSPFTVH